MCKNDTPTIYECEGDLLNRVIAQMEKELAMSGEQIHFTKNTGDSLILELATYLSTIDSNRRVQNIMYRIDVDQNKVKIDTPKHIALANALWNRVLQKVWFRDIYSKKYLSDS